MIPFPIINKYGNKLPLPEFKKMDFTGALKNSNSNGNYFGAVLMSTGKLYGFGQNIDSIFGISISNQNSISFSLDNVDNFWLIMNGILVRTVGGTMLYRGKYLDGIFCPNSPSTTPYITSGWIDVTSYFGTVGVDILDVACAGNYPDNIQVQTRAQECSLFVLSSSGVVYGMGYNDQLLINSSGAATVYTSFTQVGITGVASLRCTPYMTHNSSKISRCVLYALKSNGSVWARGYNVRSGIRSPALAEFVTAWTQVAVNTPIYAFSANTEGAIYSTNTDIYLLGGAAYTTYNMGMASAGYGNINTTGGFFNTTLSYREIGGTTNIPFTSTKYVNSSTRIRMSYGGSVIFVKGTSEIFTAHGTYCDPSITPLTSNTYFFREDIGIEVQDIIYLSQLYNTNPTSNVRGLLVIGTDGKFYVRGLINGTIYTTFTEVNFL